MKSTITKGENFFTATFNECCVMFHIPYERRHDTNLIYVLKFPNGKYYVGQTLAKEGIIERVKQHCHEGHRIHKGALRTHKTNIIAKYKRFDVFIQHKCTEGEDIDFFEQFYIGILSKRVVNITSGGQNGYRPSDEQRKMASEQMKKFHKEHLPYNPVYCYSLSGELIKKFISSRAAGDELGCDYRLVWQSCKQHTILHGKYQMRYEEDTDVKDMTEVMRGGVRIPQKDFFISINGEKVITDTLYKYSISGEFIEAVPIRSMTQSERNAAHLSIKKKVTAGGYQWHYEKKEHIDPIKERYDRASSALSYALLQRDLDGNVVFIWSRTSEAAKTLGIRARGIQSVCSGRKKTFKGFIWQYF